ncbi:MAG TPA: hypothetical protein VMW86_08230 [Dehalococcoidales bacterium]|nr:hypothetical protein [Dehalococcoidales bacterium]
MEYVYFFLVVLVLIGILVFTNKIDARAKNKWRKSAYSLLEEGNPSPEDIKNTIKSLRLYGGRWRKDKEFVQLISRLQEKFDNIKE